ncbi:SDR family NAD(P)-dependent oxidoreductase [Amycolatopsis pithecellobii]|uniref:SDR family NAD(P)-dependent oxidoreductase n=1 Tax=Amycolatopsis pithecellobii TaxID=664692 RepID=A0A6N7Z1L9_9PSEU|nr:SDR family NAD(P)-dependent oxidoreductase [Amycolatopsis pithecellobii]MTD54699.1 SDR family NAD(P)-dependent oxidoreductase [Amycolatopsis pithecellobii]
MAFAGTILVTGSTDGVGRRVVEKLAAEGSRLLVHGRDGTRGKEVVEAVDRAGGSAEFLRADFASLDDVRDLAHAIKAEYGHLDVLINNAGIARVDSARRESHDGHELHFAVNYLAPVLLTHLLRPVLGGEKPSRVVNLTSAAQDPIDFDDVMLERHYSGYRAYGQSKLADIMFTFDLAREWDGTNITVNCLHPGDHLDTVPVRAAGIRPSHSADYGADNTIALATGAGRSGDYFHGRRKSRASSQAYDGASRRRLRELTMELIGLAA